MVRIDRASRVGVGGAVVVTGRLAVALLSVVTVAACGPRPRDARSDLLRRILLEDNQHLIDRDPEQAAGKLARMALDVHSFFRGTAVIFYRDGGGATRYPPARTVLVVGDPHVENLGTFLVDGTLIIDWDDFDAAALGDYHADVRRLVVGVRLTARRGKLPKADRDRIAEAVVRAYVAELAAPTTEQAAGVIIEDLLLRARADGDAHGELLELTQMPAAPGNDEAALTALLPAWAATLPAARDAAELAAKSVSRRLGSGVSSYAALRWWIRLEGPSDSAGDDWIVELRETRPSPAARGPQPTFASEAERIVRHSRALQQTPANDFLSGWAGEYRTRWIAGYRKRLDVDRISERLATGMWGADQLRELAAAAGVQLARAHVRGGGGDVIRAALGDDAAGFVDETVTWSRDAAERVEKDYQLYLLLLHRHGPLL